MLISAPILYFCHHSNVGNDISENIKFLHHHYHWNFTDDGGVGVAELVEEDEETHLEEISDDELEEDRQAKFSKWCA